VADLSFISLRKVLPSVQMRLAAGTEGVVLLKPQFEAGPKDVPRGGVIKDAAVLERVRREFVEWLEGTGWHLYGIIASPIRGGDGNVEYLVHVRTPETANDELRTTAREL
jgi:23S rRNA (cytidine1920-2'-O)/16S rRNA (cytidine1409-2'-O)-methyltransferase